MLTAVAFGTAGVLLIIIFRLLKGLPNNVFAENFQSVEIITEDSDMLYSTDVSLAARTVQEGEVDSLGAPSRT